MKNSTEQENNTEEVRFHPFRLLSVILGVTAVLALISYGFQVYYLGVG